MCKTIRKFPSGIVMIPPSKSAAHRAVLCAALANGESRLEMAMLSRDIRATLNGVESMGAQVNYSGGCVVVRGIQDPPQKCLLDCDESGSTLRFLLPVAAALGISATFEGNGRLMERPLSPYEGILRGFQQNKDAVSISGGLSAEPYRLPGDVSSQFVSGLLFALPLLGGGTIEIEGRLQSAPYVDMTMEMMGRFGVSVLREDDCFFVPKDSIYQPIETEIEGDYSQAAFFLTAAALGRSVACLGLQEASKQGDRAIMEILRQCGAEIVRGTRGEVTIKAGTLCGFTADVSNIPDLVPILAVLACYCNGESRIECAARLRLKESDRLSAISTELRKLGADIEEGSDFLHIRGGSRLSGGTVSSWNDHRIAMALAVAAIGCEREVTIEGAEAVDKSYPGFWDDFEKEGR